MQKLRIVTWISGGLTFRFSRRPPNSLDRILARSHMYTHAAKVGICPSFQGYFLSPRAKPQG
jgi:hypothetical protein